jgi:hypothetical protein
MPFKSEAQRRFLWMKHPEIARKWSDKYGSRPKSDDDDDSPRKKRKKKRHDPGTSKKVG